MFSVLKNCGFCKKKDSCLDKEKAIKLQEMFEEEYPNFYFECKEYDSNLTNAPKYLEPKIKLL